MKKQYVMSTILAVLLGLVALSCGPGNATEPFTGSSNMIIVANEDIETIDLVSNGGRWKYLFDAQVTDENNIPVPNIEVSAYLLLIETTLQDYHTEPFRMTSDGNTMSVLFGDEILTTRTNFNGEVRILFEVPPFFDGELLLVLKTAYSSTSIAVTVAYNSGTTCTDDTDNDTNGFIDSTDLNCPNGSSVEPSIGTGTFTATQVPASVVANSATVKGVAQISVTGGTAPFTFVSSNIAAATVNLATGLITAVAAGTTGITVTDNLGLTALVNVTVADIASVTISPTTATLSLAGVNTQQMTPSVQDATATNLVGLSNSDYTWVPLTPTGTFADVNSNGFVTGKGAGVENITASIGAITSPAGVITVTP